MDSHPLEQNLFGNQSDDGILHSLDCRGLGSEGQSPGTSKTCRSNQQLALLLSLGAQKSFSLTSFHPSHHMQTSPNPPQKKLAPLLRDGRHLLTFSFEHAYKLCPHGHGHIGDEAGCQLLAVGHQVIAGRDEEVRDVGEKVEEAASSSRNICCQQTEKREGKRQ